VNGLTEIFSGNTWSRHTSYEAIGAGKRGL
jgi:hypothetical protein